MLIDIIIKIVEPAGKFVLRVLRSTERKVYKPVPARVTYHTTRKE